MARIYANLGEPDRAMEWLERTYEVNRPAIILISTDPALDPLREDPRFHDLLGRVGLAERTFGPPF